MGHYSIKQVIVVRKDLNMRTGKIAAQTAHASFSFLSKKIALPDALKDNSKNKYEVSLTKEERLWMENSFAKICVYVNSFDELQEIHNKAKDAGLVSHMIIDSGKTEFKGQATPTCISIGPDQSVKIDKITGHLKLL